MYRFLTFLLFIVSTSSAFATDDSVEKPPQLMPVLWQKILVLVPTSDYKNAALVSKGFYRVVHDRNTVLAHFGQIVGNRESLGIRYRALEYSFNSLWPVIMNFVVHDPNNIVECRESEAFEKEYIKDVKILWNEVNLHYMWLGVGLVPDELKYKNFWADLNNPNNLDNNPHFRGLFSNYDSFNLLLKSFYIKNSLRFESGLFRLFFRQLTNFLPGLCRTRLWLCSNDRWQPPILEAGRLRRNAPFDILPEQHYINENGFIDSFDNFMHYGIHHYLCEEEGCEKNPDHINSIILSLAALYNRNICPDTPDSIKEAKTLLFFRVANSPCLCGHVFCDAKFGLLR